MTRTMKFPNRHLWPRIAALILTIAFAAARAQGVGEAIQARNQAVQGAVLRDPTLPGAGLQQLLQAGNAAASVLETRTSPFMPPSESILSRPCTMVSANFASVMAPPRMAQSPVMNPMSEPLACVTVTR